jgi:hypothetical protein
MLGLFPYFSRTGQQTAVSRSQESGVRSQESGVRRKKEEEGGRRSYCVGEGGSKPSRSDKTVNTTKVPSKVAPIAW